jgi:RNA polymerase-binding protein DksA
MQQRQAKLQSEVREVFARTGEYPFGELADVPDIGDQSVMELLQDLDNAAVHRAIEEIRDIDSALQRIEDGTYGQCIDCSLPIGYKRLEAFPTAKRCLPCQEQYEKTHAHATAPSL